MVTFTSLCGSDDSKRVLLLKQNGSETVELPGIEVEVYDSEPELVSAIFRTLNEYPFVLTFNGDDFDLRYLFHRALNHLGFYRDQIPIELGRESATVKYGVHLDLYKFFFNRSIQVYAFSNRYREVTLDAVSEALLETGKLDISAPVSRLSPTELAAYCYQDAELVMNLTSFDGEVVMKLITALSRISFLPMEDMARQGVSGWIRSMMFREHRSRGFLIPRSEESTANKGSTTTRAVMTGKKYTRGMGVAPLPGVDS